MKPLIAGLLALLFVLSTSGPCIAQAKCSLDDLIPPSEQIRLGLQKLSPTEKELLAAKIAALTSRPSPVSLDRGLVTTTESAVFGTPEDAVKAYLTASTLDERLRCVLNPESVRNPMAARLRNVDLRATKGTFKPGALSLVDKLPLAVGKQVIVKVDVSQNLPDREYSRYAVVLTENGFKIDWHESMKLDQEDSEREYVNALKFGDRVLEVKVLKVYQRASSTLLDVSITNKSTAFVAYCTLGAEIYDRSATYLGQSIANSANLRPGQSATTSMIYLNVRAEDVRSWKLSLTGLVVDLGGGDKRDATKWFSVREAR